MNLKLLAVDKNSEVFEDQYPIWLKHGVELIRAYSMQEAIERLTHEEFVLVGINADSINYFPQLKIMRDVTTLPIHILTSNYSYEEECKVLRLKINQYREWWPDTEESVKRGVLTIQMYAAQHQNLPVNFTSYGDIIVYPDYHEVYVEDNEIRFTVMEFDILYLLICNPKRVFTYDQIYSTVWGGDYIGNDYNSLYCEIKKIRKKLKVNPDTPEYIRTVKNLGYAFD